MSSDETESSQFNGLEVAIIGVACRFPGAKDSDQFWANLRDGVESITFLTDDELEPSLVDAASPSDPNYVRAAAILEDADRFDAAFFGITPKEADLMDPQHRVFLECAWEALENAGYDPERHKGGIGVYAGARTNTYLFNLQSNPEALGGRGPFEVGLGNDAAFLTTRASYKLNLRGPAYTLHTACSTALVAVHLACHALLSGECQMALAGGVAINVPQHAGYLYQFGSITSPDGHCRAFDAKAQGTLFGSGIGLVVLKRLEDALRDGDTIAAVIKGSAINNDGAVKASFTAPAVGGQAEVIRDALANAEVEPETISYVETHGTGTALGDPIEIRALTKAFRAKTSANGFCAIGSVKTNIGHLDAAAGSASLIKTILALKHRAIPPSLHYEKPNPQIDFDSSPFFVNTKLREWERGASPRRAGVSAFGVGGTNAHVILEEAPEAAPSPDSARPFELLVLSAKSAAALDAATANLANHLQEHPELDFADAVYTLQVGRQAFAHRRALVCTDAADAVRALRMEDPSRVSSGVAEMTQRPVVFMFPGAGAQHPGMGADLYLTEPVFRAAIDRCAKILLPRLGLDLAVLLYPPSNGAPVEARELTRPELALPALFSVEYALACLWMAWGVRPESMIGHSLGEYTAACIAGVFSLEDALALVAFRGELLGQIAHGAMFSVSLSEAAAHELLDDGNEALSLAAVNGPLQCVVAGPSGAMEELRHELDEREVEWRRLRIDSASHSALVEPVLGRFRSFVASLTLRAPSIPYVSGVSGRWVTAEEATDPEHWVRHLRQTVRFGDGIGELLKEPARLLLEVGPGQTLGTLVKAAQHPASAVLASMRHPRDPQPDAAFLQAALGKLWLAGVSVDFRGARGHERRRVPLPTYPFERQRYWIGPGKRDARTSERAAAQGKRDDVGDWFFVPTWQRAALPAPADEPSAEARPWVLFVEEGASPAAALGRELVGLLEAQGREVITVVPSAVVPSAGDPAAGDPAAPRLDSASSGSSRYAIDPSAPGDYVALMNAFSERVPEVFVHLWSLSEEHGGREQGDRGAGRARFEAAQSKGYYSLLFLAKALGRLGGGRRARIEIVANGVHAVGDEPLAPEKATLLGPCKVIPQEHENLGCRCIDVAFPSSARSVVALATQLLGELRAEPKPMMVAYRGGRRYVQTFAPLRLEGSAAPARPLRKRGVYLITGGLGAVGLQLAEYLAETYQARLALMGRTPLPPRDQWDAWLASHGEDDKVVRQIQRVRLLEQRGAEVLVLAGDVADAARLSAIVDEVESHFGALHGVLHAAGVTSGSSLYRPLTEIGAEESETQFRPKVHGVYALAEALRGRSADFVLLFSSNAAILGGLGYLTYASANLFMDAFAESMNGEPGPTWLSATWDPWPEDTKQYEGVQTSMDQYAMTVSESAEAFRRVVCSAPPGEIVVATGDLDRRLRLWIDRERTEVEVHGRPNLKTEFVAPRDERETIICDVWQQILGVDKVGVYDNFFDLGGHSLLATVVMSRLRDAFHMEIPLQQLFEAPTVAQIAESIRKNQADAEAEEPEKAELLRLLSELSDEDVEREIQRREGEEP